MLKLIAITTLSLGLTHQAMANYNCTSITEGKEQLKIVDGPHSSAEVTLQTSEGPLIFNGKSAPLQQDFHLSDENGQPASLKIVIQQSYGGRCGRCTPEVIKATYAKLIYTGGELNFICSYETP
jgi:hypothetical protein